MAVLAGVTAPSWALPISEFLENGVLPMDETEARQIQRRASAYSIINNELIKRSFTGVFQRCVEQDKGIEILLDIHQARPIKKLDGPTTVRFIKDIAVRYGMPNSIITDNGTNFAKGALVQYCSVSGIRLDQASVAHPQSNGQVERANGLILSGIKPRLVEPLIRSPGSWLDELPAVLWSLCTTPNRSTGFTPFFLVYRAEIVIPTNVEFDSPHVTMYTEAEAKEAREDGVDLLKEARLLALSRSAIYQQGLRHYHSKKIKPLAFREGDLILRLVQEQTGQHKLSSPWEGPFIVSKALCDRNAYYLIDTRKTNKRKRDTAGEETTQPWNAELLRPFYS
ncbi:uncharacterized protein [Aegilops tauschii subsp. strangulata]|uniref:uncharacterized protein n=1 Tax=Aegilops tauschii subsp. strangulata TaxID=200361 RepID=UPI003CC85712